MMRAGSRLDEDRQAGDAPRVSRRALSRATGAGRDRLVSFDIQSILTAAGAMAGIGGDGRGIVCGGGACP